MPDPSPWSYLSPSGPHSAEVKEQGSRFIAHLSPAPDPDRAMAFLDDLRRRYHDATHHCWAYRCGWAESLKERCGDDGEPSRTAGPPILAAVAERGVSDASLVVVRYFGGVKLGTGGLARAYRAAARAVLDGAPVDTRTLAVEWLITLPYAAQGPLRHACAQSGVELREEAYGDSLTLCARVPREREAAFGSALAQLREAWKGGVTWKSK